MINDNNSFISFTYQFKYLRSIIDFILHNITDINIYIKVANKIIGIIEFIQEAKEVSLETKFKLYVAIPINFVLWNRETCAGNITNLDKLNTFYYKVIHRILKVRMSEVKDEKITNEQIRLRFNKNILNYLKFRELKY